MKKFEEKWTVKNAPFNYVEMIYFGDTKYRKRLLGHKYGGHYFVSKNQTTTFFLNKKTEKKISKIGKIKYQDYKFLNRFFKICQKIIKEIEAINQRNTNLKENTTKNTLFKLFDNFYQTYCELVAVYRFTRPDVYQGLIEKYKKKIPGPKEKNLSLLLDNNFNEINFPLNPKIKKIFINLKKVGNLRFKMHDAYLEAYLKAGKLFKQISKKCNLSSLEVKSCSYKEIKNVLLKNTKPSKKEIKMRIKYFKLVYKEHTYNLSTNKPKKQHQISKKKEIKGTIAYSGQVKGKVKFITHIIGKSLAQEIKDMNKGDILVSVSTSPDLMPAIKKAGGIITDVGGLLSHAAIVSRELKIPCLVGTKIATKVLKDGDEVLLDANKGIVKKI